MKPFSITCLLCLSGRAFAAPIMDPVSESESSVRNIEHSNVGAALATWRAGRENNAAVGSIGAAPVKSGGSECNFLNSPRSP